jgi:hypothetical protein
MPVKGTPASGGYSTVGDLLRFSVAWLEDRLLGLESTETLLEVRVRINQRARCAYGFVDTLE